jgi:pimeloyl-ACP methyl ester carboxylesterase
VRERELVSGGLRCPLIQAGPEDASEAVVFVHGFPASSRCWEALLPRVAELGRAVAWDMPGFGKADKPRGFDYTVDGFARFMQAALEQLRIERAHLVLHDFGGPWGMAWASVNTERLGSVVMMNSGILAPGRWHSFARQLRRPIVGELVMAATTRRAWRRANSRDEKLPPAFIEALYDDYDWGTRRAGLSLYRATDFGGPEYERIVSVLGPLDPPALMIFGEKDPFVPVKAADRNREALRSAKLETLPESGHWPMVDDPDGVWRVLEPFLRRRLAG